MKILRIVGLPMLALVLVLGLAFPTLAAPDLEPPQATDAPPRTLIGTVVDLDENQQYFVIQSGAWEATILVDDDTQYFKSSPPQKAIALAKGGMELKQQHQHRAEPKPQWQERLEPWGLRIARLSPMLKIMTAAREQIGLGQPNQESLEPGNSSSLRQFAEEASFNDIDIGARVMVRVVPGEDNPLAKVVVIIEPTTYQHVIGTITGISSVDKTITIAPDDGSEQIVLTYNEATRFILRGVIALEEGQSIRAVYDDDMVAKVVWAPIEVPELAE